MRVDRTEPEVCRVDVPLLLTTWDTFPPTVPRRDRPRPGQQEADQAAAEPEEPEAEEPERDYFVRLPYPFGRFLKRGTHHNWTLTAFLAGEGLGPSGSLGRAASANKDVRADPVVAGADDPESGGIGTLPFVFNNVLVDHDDLADLGSRRNLDHDISLWPIFAWGDGDKPEHDYLSIFPFGGTTRGIFGKEKITWYGFPYPIVAQVEDRSYESTHVLWPFVNWLEGPRNEGFRIWPFYGHYERKGLDDQPIYDRTWVMWPFLTWSTSGRNEAEQTDVFFALPFYGQVRGPARNVTSVLWPFFKYETFRNGDWELRAPFPFFQIAGGEERWKLDLWPFLGFKERGDFFRWFLMWPFWRSETIEGEELRFRGRWLMPFFQSTRWERGPWESPEVQEDKLQVWPLFHTRRYRDGSRDAQVFSPWIFDDAGFNRIFGPLFRLYRYHRDARGGVEHQGMWGLWSYRDLPDGPERDRYARISLLFGLIHYRQLGREKGLRLLWLLPELTWGQPSQAVRSLRARADS